ncbi:MAG: hypothetical protein COB25_014825 [Oceanospirillales bacterium]|nr:hypothetical protein [Oceanospirillales bacterium]
MVKQTGLILIMTSAFLAPWVQAGFGNGFDTTWTLKNLTLGSRSLINDNPYVSNVTRIRLEPQYRQQNWSFQAAYDLEFLSGSFLDSPEFALLKQARDPRYWALQNKLDESGELVIRHQLYRGTLQWRSPVGDFRLGRQQINWATTLIWNPMDILNPVSPLQLEPDERIGVDALLWDKSWGALGRISAVYAPQHNTNESSGALRIKRFIGGIDASVMAGEFADVTKVGVSGSGSVAGTGWRTEMVWSDREEAVAYWQAVANLNWSLRNGVNLALEYYYNGKTVQPRTLEVSRLTSGEPHDAGRHYTGVLVSQDINPLWDYRVVVIRNADDASWVLYPRSTWTLPMTQEVYLTAGAQWFGGDNDGEFGKLEPLALLELQWFF